MPETAPGVRIQELESGPSEGHGSAAQFHYQAPMSHVLIAGGVGGAVGDTLMYPLDTVKTRQQGAGGLAKYSSMASATRTILKEEGMFFGIYRGYVAAILGSFPSTMLFFGAYESTKRYMAAHTPVEETSIHLVAGFVGDLASSVIYVPSEVLKTRLQLQGPFNNKHFASGYNYRGIVDAVKTIWRTEGPSTLFYGYKATLVRDLPFSALQLAFYEKFHASARQYKKSRDIGTGLELGTGAAAGGLAGVITTPLDVVKTRIQTQTDGKILSTVQGLRYIARTEGLGGVFSGVGPRFVWTSVQSSIMLFFYQAVIRNLETASTRTPTAQSALASE